MMLNVHFQTALNNFASIPSMLNKMNLLIQIEEKIAGIEYNVIALGIKTHIYKKTPAAVILKEMKEMAQDNFPAIACLLGNTLTKKILAL